MIDPLAEDGLIDKSLIKIIGKKDFDMDYPFEFSTSLAAPEWPFAVMPHIPTVNHRRSLIQIST